MFGGTDPENLTLTTLKLLQDRSDIDKINVIVSSSAKHVNEVSGFCEINNNVNLYISPSNIAELMLNSTLSIGAAGTTSWERCAMGLPAVVVIQADNQRQIAKELEKVGVVSVLEVNEMLASLNDEIEKWLVNDGDRLEVVKLCLNICDGNGVSRLVDKVFGCAS
jgi:UDP-2,4-diacetamido-2,4,6-trideoxy-beta-L-altropyranose hydrolase